LNVLQQIAAFPELELIGLFVQEDSLLHKKMNKISLPNTIVARVFTIKEKVAGLEEISELDFDIIISNGCPFIFPVDMMKKAAQLFVNVHPTLLPYLKGKTPLNGVFMTHQKAIGATMHYIDEGIDTGNIIAQQKISLSDDIDQGLVYKISFDLESLTFQTGMKLLIDSNYSFEGTKQISKGTYFNRTKELQTIEVEKHSTDVIIDKVKSFGIKSQGSFMTIGGVQYKIYSAEKIVNHYLLTTYSNLKPGETALEYENKIILKTIDGMIKLVDYELLPSKN